MYRNSGRWFNSHHQGEKDEYRLGARLLTSDALTTLGGCYERLFRKPIKARNAAD